ncbi:glycosyltransferase family 2 protein [Candidatus Saccharibacteria bacterium]|nr:glycosyltransferase family 2 protein [Candidatus Saccharibacteria bacterium]
MTTTEQTTYDPNTWQLPVATEHVFAPKRQRYCLVVPVWNEGQRIKNVLTKLQAHTDKIDIVVIDRGSTDGSTDAAYLQSMHVRALLVLGDTGAPPSQIVTGAQLRLGYAFAMQEGYDAVITIDGNDKDDVPALPNFIKLLEEGYDFVQASRYAPGGKGVNTPWVRDLVIQYIHVPIVSWLAGFSYTDTTQGYRAYSRALLTDPRLAIFRNDFIGYELLVYLSVNAPRKGFRVTETPVTRTYPAKKKAPTKITFIKGNLALLKTLLDVGRKRYDPR